VKSFFVVGGLAVAKVDIGRLNWQNALELCDKI
jgi:hypothetical protein